MLVWYDRSLDCISSIPSLPSSILNSNSSNIHSPTSNLHYLISTLLPPSSVKSTVCLIKKNGAIFEKCPQAPLAPLASFSRSGLA